MHKNIIKELLWISFAFMKVFYSAPTVIGLWEKYTVFEISEVYLEYILKLPESETLYTVVHK